MAYGMAAAAVMTAGAGILNHFFDLGLGLSAGGSDLPLPDHIGEVLFLSLALLIIAGIFQLLSDLGKAWTFAKERKKTTASLILGSVVVIGLGIMGLAGGPLGLAVEAGDTEKVRAVLEERDYEIQELNPHLYQALKRGLLDMAEALYDEGADPNHQSGEFNTPLLSSAVTFFPKESVQWLLDKEADPNVTDRLGRTTVHLLLLYRSGNILDESADDRLGILKALRSKGAKLDVKAEDGRTPADVAKGLNLKWALEYLESQGISVPEPK